MDDLEIGFVCKNSSKFYVEGKMKLAVPFVIEYGSTIKEKVFLEMPTGEVWFGKYVKGSDYVEGLSELMSFYGVRPYHIVLFNYSGDEHFKLRIFNECGVEICYPFSCPLSSHLRARRNDPFIFAGNMKLDGTEIDKLACTFKFNVFHNFRGVHDILISKEHLTLQTNYKVISSSDFEKLGMDEAVQSMEFCFEQNSWQIGLFWKKGCLFFDKGWYEFVKSAKVVEGDICVLAKTAASDKFEIAVLSKVLLTQWSLTSDRNIVNQRFSWVKILKGSSLDRGSVEIPRLFARRLGSELGRDINLLTADGRVFHGKYSVSENILYGLMDLISAYDIYKNCLIGFEYVGTSTFNVSIFDSLNMDHLKEITGEFIVIY
ncbi:hypothetical protein POM88_032961 [Heracleum sosnowskyi]|uniref:TF-B3 domain-containing protein n=1 Tax=Heracleum sosnowskyi TaxID=360622 RepID=A0AAD8I2M8_9APIA|nr:hypothetical protein POM88_032961 [Heracleum sosnowskyi]